MVVIYELRTTFTEWDSEDILNAETGNCFKTGEEAQAMLTKNQKTTQRRKTMKQYKLTQDFAGFKAGDVLDRTINGYMYSLENDNAISVHFDIINDPAGNLQADSAEKNRVDFRRVKKELWRLHYVVCL